MPAKGAEHTVHGLRLAFRLIGREDRAIQYIFWENLRKSGIQKKANVYTLRHSYATHFIEQGVDIISLRDLLGHQDI